MSTPGTLLARWQSWTMQSWPLRSWPLVAVALLCGGCEPTQLEAGQCIVLVTPIITAIGIGLHVAYALLWPPLEPAPRVSWRITGEGLLVLFILAVIVLVSGLEREVDDWLGVIFMIVGASYLTVLLLVMRLTLMPRLRRGYAWAPLLPWLVYLPPALWLTVFGSPHDPVPALLQAVWILPGFGGYVSGPLLALIFVEAGVRRYLYHRANPPPMPPALPRSVVIRQRKRSK